MATFSADTGDTIGKTSKFLKAQILADGTKHKDNLDRVCNSLRSFLFQVERGRSSRLTIWIQSENTTIRVGQFFLFSVISILLASETLINKSNTL